MAATGEVVRVLELDPDLAEGLDPERAALARAAAIARVDVLEPGEWHGDRDYSAGAGHLGLLVLDGLMARTVQVGDRSCVELLGPGDFLRPWVNVAALSSVAMDSNWTVVERARLAVLDERFAANTARYPEIAGAVLDRMMGRSRWLSFHLAVCQLKLVEDRLLVVLWHFADRWGRVRPDGVVVPLPVTQRLLAGVVGARRPSVTTALGKLRRAGCVEPLPGGGWLLHGSPPAALGRVEERSAGRALAEEESLP